MPPSGQERTNTGPILQPASLPQFPPSGSQLLKTSAAGPSPCQQPVSPPHLQGLCSHPQCPQSQHLHPSAVRVPPDTPGLALSSLQQPSKPPAALSLSCQVLLTSWLRQLEISEDGGHQPPSWPARPSGRLCPSLSASAAHAAPALQHPALLQASSSRPWPAFPSLSRSPELARRLSSVAPSGLLPGAPRAEPQASFAQVLLSHCQSPPFCAPCKAGRTRTHPLPGNTVPATSSALSATQMFKSKLNPGPGAVA